MFALFKKEIGSFLNTLTGFLVITVFLLITALFLWVLPTDFNIPDFGYATLEGLFVLAPYVFLFLVPAITMRSFAEEQRAGTMEWLLTKPLTDSQLVLGKFAAGLTLVALSLLPTLLFYVSVYLLGLPQGNIDSGSVAGSYIGLMMLAASFVAIGLFSSSLTDNQIIAFILAVLFSGFRFIGFDFIFNLSLFGPLDLFIQQLGIEAHYRSISRGVVDTRDLIYFFSVVVLFLALTRLSLSSRKWS